jgi:hypothetical protein
MQKDEPFFVNQKGEGLNHDIFGEYLAPKLRCGSLVNACVPCLLAEHRAI